MRKFDPSLLTPLDSKSIRSILNFIDSSYPMTKQWMCLFCHTPKGEPHIRVNFVTDGSSARLYGERVILFCEGCSNEMTDDFSKFFAISEIISHRDLLTSLFVMKQ